MSVVWKVKYKRSSVRQPRSVQPALPGSRHITPLCNEFADSGGVSGPEKAGPSPDGETLDGALATPFFLSQALVPAMADAGWGRIVAITSIAVREPQPMLVLSNTLRAGLTGYLKSLADEVASNGVTVNSILPGYTATDRLTELAGIKAEAMGTTPEALLANWASMAPIGRLLEPAEVAAAAAFLCSDAASGITGHALPVDGGYGRGLL